MDKKFLFKLSIPVVILILLFCYAIFEQIIFISIPIDRIIKAEPAGTDIRLEREYKLGLNAKNKNIFSQPDVIIKSLYEEINKALNDKAQWEISSRLNNFYYCTYSPKDYLFRDIYLDTKDNINKQHSISYRLRHRWKSYKTYKDHEQNQFDDRFFPIRCEIQVKTDRQEQGNGYSKVYETRFEFRNQSLPFSDINPAPPAPWDFEQYLHYAMTGRFQDYIIKPTQEYVKFLKGIYPKKKRLWLKPKLVTLTRRFRLHLNVNTPWGSGPNPENVFIVSLDLTQVYGPEYIDFLLKSKYGGQKKLPKLKGHLKELEIEFERNVSTVLDKQIEHLKETGDEKEIKRLSNIRRSFLSDQKYLEKIIKNHFSKIGINLTELHNSKYISSFDIVYEKE